jgi:hypothetical protein
MRLYRSIATLAVLQVLCFLLLSHLEPDFFLLHFCQKMVYLALLILLFYMEDRWAYRIGILAPAGWLVLAFATGLLGACRRSTVSEAGAWPRTYESGELPGRHHHGAQRCDDCGVRSALAQGIWRPRQVIDNIRS